MSQSPALQSTICFLRDRSGDEILSPPVSLGGGQNTKNSQVESTDQEEEKKAAKKKRKREKATATQIENSQDANAVGDHEEVKGAAKKKRKKEKSAATEMNGSEPASAGQKKKTKRDRTKAHRAMVKEQQIAERQLQRERLRRQREAEAEAARAEAEADPEAEAEAEATNTFRELVSSIFDKSDPVAWEKAVNVALTAAKKEWMVDRESEELEQRYLALKEEYKTAAKAKQSLAPPKPRKKVKAAEQSEISWTCLLCRVTLPAASRETHEAGRKHLKRTAAAEANKEVAELMWTCEVCNITIAASAQQMHEAGKKHSARMAIWKKGDWFCECGQHNYASKKSCIRAGCHAPRYPKQKVG